VVVQVQPEYYGMLLFTQAGTGAMVSTTVTTSAQDFTAWAIKANGFTSVVLNNRNATSAVSATVESRSRGEWRRARSICKGRPAGNLTAAAGERDPCGRPGHGGGRVGSRSTLHSDGLRKQRLRCTSLPPAQRLVRVLQ